MRKLKKTKGKPGKLKKLDINQLKKVGGGKEIEPDDREPRYCPGGREKLCRDFEY